MFSNDLVAVDMHKSKLFLNKPVYTGITILDNSKIQMYGVFYNEIKKQYGPRCELLYTDTYSLLLEIETDDVYKDIETNKNLYDTSDYPKEHPLYSSANKTVLGKMKDECADSRMCLPETKDVLNHEGKTKKYQKIEGCTKERC